MAIGDKISYLRTTMKISQEDLSEQLSVTRQSLSKWERNVVVPKMDVIMKMCQIFDVSIDDLTRDDIIIDKSVLKIDKLANRSKHKYFGLDGFVGRANVDITSDHAYKIGKFLGWYFSSSLTGGLHHHSKPKIAIGKDTRRSSYSIQWALAAGALASGADVYILHVTTAPSVSYITREDSFDCGIMVSAGKYPYNYNGINILDSHGESIGDELIEKIERYIDNDVKSLGIEDDDIPLATKEQIGCLYDYTIGKNRYTGYLISTAAHSFGKLKIGLDCANGSSWVIAKNIFNTLGAETFTIGDDPNGININQNCGATHVEQLVNLVKKEHLDVGLAFDGNGERCIAVDELGNIVDGEKIIYLLAKSYKERNLLDKKSVVISELSNKGLVQSLKEIDIKAIKTKEGPYHLRKEVKENGYLLAGDKSGFIIINKFATSGDGLLTAIAIIEAMLQNRGKLSELTTPISLYPRKVKLITKNPKIPHFDDEMIMAKANEINEELGDNGFVSIDSSVSTDSFEVTIEAKSEAMCQRIFDNIKGFLASINYIIG